MRIREWWRRRMAYRGALVWCNVIRSLHGYRALKALPQGDIRLGRECPLGLAIKGTVGIDQAWPFLSEFSRSRQGTPLPPLVVDFVRRFDWGQYPELVR